MTRLKCCSLRVLRQNRTLLESSEVVTEIECLSMVLQESITLNRRLSAVENGQSIRTRIIATEVRATFRTQRYSGLQKRRKRWRTKLSPLCMASQLLPVYCWLVVHSLVGEIAHQFNHREEPSSRRWAESELIRSHIYMARCRAKFRSSSPMAIGGAHSVRRVQSPASSETSA